MTAIAPQEEGQHTDPWAEVLRGLKGTLPMMLGFVPFGLLLGRRLLRRA
jgi:predicted branched-subunit amino acid permease